MVDMVVIYTPTDAINSAELAAIDQLFPSALIAVIGKAGGSLIPGQRISFFAEDSKGLSKFEAFIGSMKVGAVLLRPGSFRQCSRSVLTAVLSTSTPIFWEFTDDGIRGYPFQVPDGSKRQRVLFIYPGPTAPVTNGSRQRALSLILNLVAAQVDVVVGIDRKLIDREYELFLEQFGIKIDYFKGSHRAKQAIKSVRGVGKRILGGGYFLPFFARLEYSLSRSYQRLVARYSSSVDVVVFSYAWMVPFFLRRDKPVCYVVDTHDVNFVRDKSYYLDKGFVASLMSKFGQWAEMRLLRSVDKIIAISSGDREALERSNLAKPIIELPPSFDWIGTVDGSGNVQALSFGFIGADMVANRRALDHIITKIWPLIRQERPDATLFVAGNICRHIEAKKHNMAGVIPIGFVSSLRSFYSSIDALISPVIMQGGLNIKILESLASGVPVYVNSLGNKSLAKSELIHLGEDVPTDAGIRRFLEFSDQMLNNPQLRREAAIVVQRDMAAAFMGGFQQAFPETVELLRRRETP